MAREPIRRTAVQAAATVARLRLASAGHEHSNLFIQPEIVRKGTVFQPEHDRVEVKQDSIVSFVDDEPTLNWGHRCRYLMHDPASGALLQEVPALLPPSFDFGRNFRAVHVGTPFVPVSELPKLKVPMLPGGLFGRARRQWHAILYAGASNNRHLNDIEFLYRVLVDSYGVPKTNITVLNYDGTLQYNNNDWTPHVGSIGNWPGDNTAYRVSVNGSGTKQAMLDAIAAVGKKLRRQDCLLIHTNNHGGRSGNTSTLCTYSGSAILPDDMANALKALPQYAGLMVMMEQCFAGGFIDPIVNASTADCTHVASAVDATTSSDGGANFDPFALAWIRAMAEHTESGGTLTPAVGHDAKGHVTAKDAFDWAKANGTGVHDNPVSGQNGPCGGALYLGGSDFVFRLPPLYRKLWPWEIIPDPGPEQLRRGLEVIQQAVTAGQLVLPETRTGLEAAQTRVRTLLDKAFR